MFDDVAYLLAQRQTRDHAGAALPNAPPQAHALTVAARPRLAGPRRGLSLALRRLADQVEPVCQAPHRDVRHQL
ncbi:MAG: hypothetical protein IRY97_00790 [Thermomicrobiaceae bacterium]|nr:hypothetical protein [Thermomicrobiaceae bacterium]